MQLSLRVNVIFSCDFPGQIKKGGPESCKPFRETFGKSPYSLAVFSQQFPAKMRTLEILFLPNFLSAHDCKFTNAQQPLDAQS